MATIEVNGHRYKVVESMGYNPDIGMYAKRVETPDGEKVVVGSRRHWRFWTAADRLGGRRPALTGQGGTE